MAVKLTKEALAMPCVDSVKILGVASFYELTFHLYSPNLEPVWKIDSDNVLDLAEFDASLREPGTYELLTCSCGEMGCARRWRGVRVWHHQDTAIWYDHDRDAWARFTLEDLRQCLSEVVENVHRQIAWRIKGPTPKPSTLVYCIEPFQTETYLTMEDYFYQPERTQHAIIPPPYRGLDESDETLRTQLDYLAMLAEEHPLAPLNTTLADFARVLWKIVNPVGLHRVQLLQLIAIAALTHLPEPERVLENLGEVRHCLSTGEDDWRSLLGVRQIESSFEPGKMALVATLLRLVELLDSKSCLPGAPLLFALDPQSDETAVREFWTRAYCDVTRKSNSLCVKFDLPRGKVDDYQQYLIGHRAQELERLWSQAQQALHPYIKEPEFPLVIKVSSCPETPRMPSSIEEMLLRVS